MPALKRIMAKVDLVSESCDVNGSEARVRLVCLDEVHGVFGGTETLTFDALPEDVAGFRLRIGKTVCITVEDT